MLVISYITSSGIPCFPPTNPCISVLNDEGSENLRLANMNVQDVNQDGRDIIADYMPLLEFAHRRKLQWFGHTTRRAGSLAYDVCGGRSKRVMKANKNKAHMHCRVDGDWHYNIYERG